MATQIERPKVEVPKAFKVLLVIAVIGVLGFYLFKQVTYTVQYGTVSIITRFGQIIGDPSQPGLHFKLPFIDDVITFKTQKIIYETVDPVIYSNTVGRTYNDTGIKELDTGYQDVAVDTTTKDGQQISVRFTLRFAINADKIKDIANKLGTEVDVVDKIVKTESRIWARNIPRNYSAFDLYTGNIDVVSQEIKEKLAPIFEENGLILDEFGIRSINFQEDYVKTIEQKQIEKERITTEEYIAKQEEFKKQALITKAQGEAESQKLQQQTLTDQLIKKLYIEKWDGKLPITVAGDGGNLLINLK